MNTVADAKAAAGAEEKAKAEAAAAKAAADEKAAADAKAAEEAKAAAEANAQAETKAYRRGPRALQEIRYRGRTFAPGEYLPGDIDEDDEDELEDLGAI